MYHFVKCWRKRKEQSDKFPMNIRPFTVSDYVVWRNANGECPCALRDVGVSGLFMHASDHAHAQYFPPV